MGRVHGDCGCCDTYRASIPENARSPRAGHAMRFYRRYYADTRCVVVCTRCLATLGTAATHGVADELERQHLCGRAFGRNSVTRRCAVTRSTVLPKTREAGDLRRVLHGPKRWSAPLLFLAIVLVVYGLPNLIEFAERGLCESVGGERAVRRLDGVRMPGGRAADAQDQRGSVSGVGDAGRLAVCDDEGFSEYPGVDHRRGADIGCDRTCGAVARRHETGSGMERLSSPDGPT